MKVAEFIAKCARWNAIIFLWGILLLIALEMLLRGMFSTSTLIAEEFGGYAMVTIVGFGMIEAFRQKRHIQVDLVTNRLPPPIQSLIAVLCRFVTLGVFMALLWGVGQETWEAWQYGTRSFHPSQIPMFLPKAMLGLGWLFLLVTLMAEEVGRWMGHRR